MFKVNEISFKNDAVLVSFDDFDILLLLDFYVEENLKKDNEYDSKLISKLLKEEVYTNAYLKVLNKLKYKDRTIKEVKDYVLDEFKIDQDYLDMLINNLIIKGYLDDVRYTATYINNSICSLKGIKLIKKELLDKGVATKLIDSMINEAHIDELELAINYANKVVKTVQNKSLIGAKQFVKQKLLLRGFDYQISDLALSRTDFSNITSNQADNLEKAVKKAKNRYSKKYSGYDLKNKIVTYLFSLGYKYEEINKAILQEETNDKDIY